MQFKESVKTRLMHFIHIGIPGRDFKISDQCAKNSDGDRK